MQKFIEHSPNHWDLIWRNLEKAVNIKHNLEINECEIGANMTVLIQETKDHQRNDSIVPANWQEMELLTKRAKDCGLDYVSFKPYSQHPYSFETAKLYGKMSYREIMDEIIAIGEMLIKKYGSNDFEVIFRFSRFEDYEKEQRNYLICRATPTLWSYIQSDGTWISCSAYWTDERFHLGNINSQTISDIWYGQKRKEHLNFVLNELDISQCRKTCHPDKDNQYLHQINDFSDEEFNAEIDKLQSQAKPKRFNFI